jgi:hypothetical protein
MERSVEEVRIATNGDGFLVAASGDAQVRALFHITLVVPLAVIALLSFLIVLAIQAIQDMVAFRPHVAVAYAERAQSPRRSSRALDEQELPSDRLFF